MWGLSSSAGNHDWVGSDFAFDAGVGLAITMEKSPTEVGETILEQVKASFERDWTSRYAKTQPGSKDHDSKYGNLQQVKIHVEAKEENELNSPL